MSTDTTTPSTTTRTTTPTRARRATTGGLALLLAGAVLAAAPAAQAKGDDDGQGGRAEVRRSGTCTAGAHWKLTTKQDDGALETELEVDSNRAGQRWSVVLRDNGVRVVATRRTTQRPSGSFSLERHHADRAGADRVTAVAKDLRSGQRCVASLTLGG